MADDAITAMEQEMLMVRHPKSKPPDLSKPAKYRTERGLVTRLRNGGLWGSGKRYWNSGSDTARRDFATAALQHVKAQGIPNARWTEVFWHKARDSNHVLEEDEYEASGYHHHPHTLRVIDTVRYCGVTDTARSVCGVHRGAMRGGGLGTAAWGRGLGTAADGEEEGQEEDDDDDDDDDEWQQQANAYSFTAPMAMAPSAVGGAEEEREEEGGGGTRLRKRARGNDIAEAMEADHDPFAACRDHDFITGNGLVLDEEGNVVDEEGNVVRAY